MTKICLDVQASLEELEFVDGIFGIKTIESEMQDDDLRINLILVTAVYCQK